MPFPNWKDSPFRPTGPVVVTVVSLAVVHYVWQKMQYDTVVNKGKPAKHPVLMKVESMFPPEENSKE